ncbi:MAG: galactokinase, partial [Candidatus Binataceae bacterium]
MTQSTDWSAQERTRAGALASWLHALRGTGDANDVAVRAPGRVNLIGEHTDYNGLPVLPVAIDRSTIVVASARNDGLVQIHNRDAAFTPRMFRVSRAIEPYPAGDWGNYIKAAVQGVVRRCCANDESISRMLGATMVIDGRVPVAAGLSSSAALMVGSTLAFMALNALEYPPLETSEMIALSENYVGTMSGGMDQAASIFGKSNHALLIQFDPLRIDAVAMPRDAALVVAHSHEVADKSGRVRAQYNRRVIECKRAAAIVGGALQLDGVN